MNYDLLKQAGMLKLASKAKILKGVIPQAKVWNPQKISNTYKREIPMKAHKLQQGKLIRENPHTKTWTPQSDPVSSHGS